MPRNRGGIVLHLRLAGHRRGAVRHHVRRQRATAHEGKVRIAVVDEDNTDGSRAFITKLEESFGRFDVAMMPRADAENAVRRGQRTAFHRDQAGIRRRRRSACSTDRRDEIEVGVDPARQAEAGMLEGLLMKHAAADMQKMFTDPQARRRWSTRRWATCSRGRRGDQRRAGAALPRRAEDVHGHAAAARAAGRGRVEWQPLKITKTAVARERSGPRNPFDITFPQGVIWGLIGCVMSFGISLVTERTHGTFVRLRMAPLTRAQILGGKALACFLAIMVVRADAAGGRVGLRRAADVVRAAGAGRAVRGDLASSAS